MARYAPNYMSVYDGYTLEDLELSADTFVDNDAEDTVIGALTGMAAAGSTISVITGEGKVKISGSNLVVGPDANSAGSLAVSVREVNPNGEGGYHDTDFTLTVTAA